LVLALILLINYNDPRIQKERPLDENLLYLSRASKRIS